jgi:beta-1,2-mannobiose phosphorylase / 1,2-beta-oligomannan phosphorylase
MSVPKLHSTLSGEQRDLCQRVSPSPLLTPSDVYPSDPRLTVIGVLNPAFALIGGVPRLIVRVDERPAILPEPVHNGTKPLDVAFVAEWPGGPVRILRVTVAGAFDPDRISLLPPEVRESAFLEHGVELYLSFVSHLRVVRIDEQGYHVDPQPLLAPSNRFAMYGCEDPRAVFFDGLTHVTYNAIGSYGVTAWLATLRGDSGYVQTRMLLGPDHKHSTLFPARVNGRYVMAVRPLTRTSISSEGVWLFSSADLNDWGRPVPLLHPRPQMWDAVRVGPGPAPILLDDGWLFLYYGVDRDHCYHVGAALLNRSDPTVVLSRSLLPVLSPILPWERYGRRADTVFPCGAFLLPDRMVIRIYYGAADTYVGMADLPVDTLLSSLVPIR